MGDSRESARSGLEIPDFGAPVPSVIYDALRKAIVDGVYHPGESIRQEALARRFSVSRVPIREALARLEADGLIVLRPRRGYLIKELDSSEIAEIFEMRAVMEEHAAFVATRCRTTDDVRDLQIVLARMDEISEGPVPDASKWVDLNHEFHNRIFSSSGRQHLCQAINNYRGRIDSYIRAEIGLTGKLNEARRDHRRIMAAFKKGDAALVASLSREHCMRTCERLLKGLKAKTIG